MNEVSVQEGNGAVLATKYWKKLRNDEPNFLHLAQLSALRLKERGSTGEKKR
jgi:hypothetical protein